VSRGSAGVVLYPSKPPWSIQVTTLFGAPLYPRPSYANLVPHPGVGGERRGERVAHGDDLTRFFFFREDATLNPIARRAVCST